MHDSQVKPPHVLSPLRPLLFLLTSRSSRRDQHHEFGLIHTRSTFTHIHIFSVGSSFGYTTDSPIRRPLQANALDTRTQITVLLS
ncbi:hypothetical protein TSMEX_008414 [Taenia solium]|eukprot:TsM_000220900 transcript=TsM_000220900 gene=TsM_000220900